MVTVAVAPVVDTGFRGSTPWEELEALWPRPVQWNVPMERYTTLRVGGQVKALLEVQSEDELRLLWAWLRRHQVPWLLLGRGSNLLVRSHGFPGLFVRLTGSFNRIRRVPPSSEEQVEIEVGAGCPVAALTGWCIRHQVQGFEFMAGIPGTLGGAVRMNAGAWGHEMGALLQAITVMGADGQVRLLPRQRLQLGYRSMDLVGGGIRKVVITSVRLALGRGNGEVIRRQCLELMRRRQAKQPLVPGSAGSFFKNPPGDSAGRLIEAAGLKGLRRGRAMVSTRHANFIVNIGGATATDIDRLWREVQQRVADRFGVTLEPEVVIV